MDTFHLHVCAEMCVKDDAVMLIPADTPTKAHMCGRMLISKQLVTLHIALSRFSSECIELCAA